MRLNENEDPLSDEINTAFLPLADLMVMFKEMDPGVGRIEHHIMAVTRTLVEKAHEDIDKLLERRFPELMEEV